MDTFFVEEGLAGLLAEVGILIIMEHIIEPNQLQVQLSLLRHIVLI